MIFFSEKSINFQTTASHQRKKSYAPERLFFLEESNNFFEMFCQQTCPSSVEWRKNILNESKNTSFKIFWNTYNEKVNFRNMCSFRCTLIKMREITKKLKSRLEQKIQLFRLIFQPFQYVMQIYKVFFNSKSVYIYSKLLS